MVSFYIKQITTEKQVYRYKPEAENVIFFVLL